MKVKVKHSLRIGTVFLFIGVFSLTVLLRIQDAHNIPEGQFTGNDAYFYYRQARLVSEHGKLPERDMHRWVPVGRDNGQTLNLYGYVLAYGHKALAGIAPNITLYHVAFYAPVFCFSVGLSILCVFLYKTHGTLFSVCVGILLTTLPGTIDRSSAGFADRDAWCFMLGILAFTTYLAALDAEKRRNRLLWTLVSGFTVFLGGISWEGFGVFLGILLCVELWRFLSSETEEGFGYYCLWVLLFVPTLYLASPAYQSGYGFAKHLFALMLVPPVVVLAMRALRGLLLSKVGSCRRHARSLALGLVLAGLTFGSAYCFWQRHTFADTTVLLSQNRLMQAVGELRVPTLKYWTFRFGSVFILGSIGILIANRQQSSSLLLLTPAFLLFTMETFFRETVEKYLWNASENAFFFAIVLTYCLIVLLLTAKIQKSQAFATLGFTLWFLIWASLARDARRYDLFLSVPLAFFATQTIRWTANRLSQKIWHSKYITDMFRQDVPEPRLKTLLCVVLLGCILFWPITGGHARRAYKAPSKLRNALPGNMPVTKAFAWMKSQLPPTAVVAAHWSYGGQLNVLAGVKTITDPDHYIQQWIHFYNRYVQHANDAHAALTFLKTHQATHLMITDKHPPPVIKNSQVPGVFCPVYPTDTFEKSMVKIWEIRYPPDIQPKRKYLKTGIHEIDAALHLR